jgi:hypothetical protein
MTLSEFADVLKGPLGGVGIRAYIDAEKELIDHKEQAIARRSKSEAFAKKLLGEKEPTDPKKLDTFAAKVNGEPTPADKAKRDATLDKFAKAVTGHESKSPNVDAFVHAVLNGPASQPSGRSDLIAMANERMEARRKNSDGYKRLVDHDRQLFSDKPELLK